MRFSRVSLENWRNFGHVDAPLQNRVFLVGPNASGKSNFLDLFRFLRDLVSPGGGFQASVTKRGGVSRIRNLAARRYPDIVVQVDLEEKGKPAWRYRLAFAQDNQGRPILKGESVWRESEQILERPDDEDQADEARLRRILTALQVAVPQLRELKLDKDKGGVPHLYGNYEHWRPQGAWQTEADFSDGTLRLLGLLWALLDGSGPLLLEEPELSLHPEIVGHIPAMMLRIQRGSKRPFRQIFMSTHSSDLLRDEGIAADEILLTIPAAEGTEIRVGAEIDEVRRLLETGLTPADVVIPHTRPANVVQISLL